MSSTMNACMQLEFAQAMSDFKIMFPDMDRDVIEAVLRANQGAVDATIDQLLAMSVDNQNEILRNQLDDCSKQNKDQKDSSTMQLINIDEIQNTTIESVQEKQKINQIAEQSGATRRRWNPPILGPLPDGFLRISNLDTNRTDDLPDEQFALMLQNEEFMNELKWNQEFMNTLEKEQQDKGRTEDDAAFKERLKHMGKVSRKKFLQMARVFTWQRNKKIPFRHPNSLLLKEEHSDDEDGRVKI